MFQLRIEDARTFLSLIAPEVSGQLDCIENQLRPVWEQEAHEQAARPLPHRAGDLLWRSSAGWAVCLEDSNGGENTSSPFMLGPTANPLVCDPVMVTALVFALRMKSRVSGSASIRTLSPARISGPDSGSKDGPNVRLLGAGLEQMP